MQLWVSFEISWKSSGALGSQCSTHEGMVIECGKQLICCMRLAIPIKTYIDYTIKQRKFLIMISMARKYQLPCWRVLGYHGIPIHSSHFFSSSFLWFPGMASPLRPRFWRQGTGARHIEVQIMGDSGRGQGMIIRHDPLMISNPTPKTPGNTVHNYITYLHCAWGWLLERIDIAEGEFDPEDGISSMKIARWERTWIGTGRSQNALEEKWLVYLRLCLRMDWELRTMQNLCHCPSIYSMHMGVLYDIGIKKNMVVSVTLYR